jgi:C_GCAxxG_C_C family probable redox protein
MEKRNAQTGYERGFEFERQYHGCAQCVVGAVYEVFPEMRNADIFRAASGLAAGTGLTTTGQCGALTGAVMVLSQLYGRQLDEIDDPEKKRFVAYRLAEKMIHRFLEEYGTVICGDIQKRIMGRSFYLFDPEQWDAFEKAGGHNEKCPSVVGNATRWAVEMMEEQETKPVVS